MVDKGVLKWQPGSGIRVFWAVVGAGCRTKACVERSQRRCILWRLVRRRRMIRTEGRKSRVTAASG